MQISARRVHYLPSPARLQRGEWKDQKNHHHESYRIRASNITMYIESDNRNSESAGIGNERNLKQCYYYQNIKRI